MSLFVVTCGLAPAATISFTSAAGPALPDSSVAGVNVSIVIPATSALFIVPGNSITVTLNNMNHSWVGDLRATLTGPGGITRTVFDRPGVPNSTYGCAGNLAPNRTYSFNSSASSLLAVPCNGTIPTGTYRTLSADDATNTNLSSAWAGFNAAGTTWTLNLADLAGQDLQPAGWTWTLTINYVDTPEPATLLTTAMGFGLLIVGLWRRRAGTPESSPPTDGKNATSDRSSRCFSR